MKLMIALIAALYLIQCTVAGNSRMLTGYGEGGGKDDDVLLGGYAKVSKEELDTVIELVSKIEGDVQGLLGVEEDCGIKVLSAQKQIVAGTNYVVNVKSCKPDKEPDQIKFFLDLPVNDPDQLPQNLELLILNGEEVDDTVTSDGTVVDYVPVADEDMAEVEADIVLIDAEIRELLSLEEGATITVSSAMYQVMESMDGTNFRVTLSIEGVAPNPVVNEDGSISQVGGALSIAIIQYYKDSAGNISNLSLYTEEVTDSSEEEEEPCMPGGFCSVEDSELDQLRSDVEGIVDEIRAMLVDAGYTVDNEITEIEVVSAQRQVVAEGLNNKVIINMGIVRNVEIQYFTNYNGDVDLDTLQLNTMPPEIEEYAAEDGSERVMIECEPGFVVEKGVCVREEEQKEKSKLKDSKEEEHSGRGDDDETGYAAADEKIKKDESLLGAYEKCEDEEELDELRRVIEERLNEIRDELEFGEECEATLESAEKQVVAGMKYKITLLIDCGEDAEVLKQTVIIIRDTKGDYSLESQKKGQKGYAGEAALECPDGYRAEKGECVPEGDLKEQSKLKEEKEEEHTGYAGEAALECPDGYRAEKGECVPEADLKEQSKLKEEKEEEHTGDAASEEEEDETAYAGEAAIECPDGYRAEKGECVPEGDLKEQSKLKEEKEEEHTGDASSEEDETAYAGEAAIECPDGYRAEKGECVPEADLKEQSKLKEEKEEEHTGQASSDEDETAYAGEAALECPDGYRAEKGECVPAADLKEQSKLKEEKEEEHTGDVSSEEDETAYAGEAALECPDGYRAEKGGCVPEADLKEQSKLKEEKEEEHTDQESSEEDETAYAGEAAIECPDGYRAEKGGCVAEADLKEQSKLKEEKEEEHTGGVTYAEGEKGKKDEELAGEYEKCENEDDLEKLRVAIRELASDIRKELDNLDESCELTLESADQLTKTVGVSYKLTLLVDCGEDEVARSVIILYRDSKGTFSLESESKGQSTYGKGQDYDEDSEEPVEESEAAVRANYEGEAALDCPDGYTAEKGECVPDEELKEKTKLNTEKEEEHTGRSSSDKEDETAAAESEKVKKDEVLLGEYEKCEDEAELEQLREAVEQKLQEIRDELELEDECHVTVESADKQVVAGINYKATIVVDCGEDKELEKQVIILYRDLKGDYSLESEKKGSKANAYAEGEKGKKDEELVGEYEKCENEDDLEKLRVAIRELVSDIRKELDDLDESCEITLESADQLTKTVGVSYKVTLLIDCGEEELSRSVIILYRDSKGTFSLESESKGQSTYGKEQNAANSGKTNTDCACPMSYDPVRCIKGEGKAQKCIDYASSCDAECDGKDLSQCESGRCSDLESSEDDDDKNTDPIRYEGADAAKTVKKTAPNEPVAEPVDETPVEEEEAEESVEEEEDYTIEMTEFPDEEESAEDEEEDDGSYSELPSDSVFAGNAENENTDDLCLCTLEYDPFCCEGTTYDNACNARCAGFDCPRKNCKRGSCDSQTCTCPYVYSPICCNDENYPNECTAECVGIDASTCSPGKCEEECACTREYNPFCCEGETYANPCLARCDGHRFINFKCDAGVCEKNEPCFCPANYEPVCCNKGEADEKEYGNMCMATCDLAGSNELDKDSLSVLADKCEIGACDEDPGCYCTKEWNPTCCLGTKTYGNMCQAKCDGFDESQCTAGGACQDINICTMEYAPLCCNGKTYANPCLAELDGISEPAEDQSECDLGECKQPSICTAEYEPLCCGGVTYGNECNAKAAGFEDPLRDCVPGRCDQSVCTLDWRPMCCEGDTYSNACMARRAGIEAPTTNCLAGRCEDQLYACPKILSPVCCLGDKEYDNECIAEANGFTDVENQCETGTCDSVCACPLNYDPYCCGDRGYNSKSTDLDGFKTYGNQCVAECAGFDVDSDECTKGECGSAVCSCTMDYNPMCCDGVTYPNACSAECAGVDAPAEYQTDRCVMGTCESQCICTRDYNPICCDGEDFANPCTARCHGVSNPNQCSSGRCDQIDECICTREYEPMCCNGVDYSNPCVAKCDGQDCEDESKCQRGTCDSACACSLEHAPVCCSRETELGTVQKEYGNECMAKCGGVFDVDTECQSGECDAVGICTLEWNPYCCDGETYGNPCMAREGGFDDVKNNEKCTKGQCIDEECKCTKEFDPYCCDGLDYDNSCVAKCDGFTDAEKECSKGKCDNNDCKCTKEFDPLCCNGKTYTNPCEAECAGIEEPAEDQDECTIGSCETNVCICTMEYNPICCDGVDYPNPCAAECDGITEPAEDQRECAMGKCCDQDKCICTKELNPVCCQDDEGNNLDYDNPCLASCDGIKNPLKKCEPGRCDDEPAPGYCACTREYRPMCCNGIDYANPCIAECDGIKEPAEEQDECKPMQCSEAENVCKCTKESNPYCCNGEEYENSCLARCDGVFAPEYFCQRGRCDEQPEACTLEYNPICCNGRDYSNPCFAEKDGGVTSPAEEQDECQMGKCSECCKCTKELNPMCCDDKEYSNPCLAECAGFDTSDEDKCSLGVCEKACKCTREMNPYCCDEREYSNPCAAECNGFENPAENDKCRRGRCNRVNFCTMEYNPQCCDGKTYSNPCIAEKVGGFEDAENNDKCKSGACDSTGGGSGNGPCTTEYEPYCCSKTTFDNKCLAEQEGFDEPENNNKCKPGKCSVHKKDTGTETESSSEEVSGCTKDLDPICCEDKDGIRVTYDNPCLAEQAGFKEPAEEQPECKMGECEGIDSCECPLVYEPVCCEDNKGDVVDYASLCDAKCEGVSEDKCSDGKCKEETDCTCTREYEPVCCYEKDDYDNKCLAECALSDPMNCPQDVACDQFDDVCVEGSCASIGCECSEEYEPLCCDGKTYENECVAKCNGKDCTKDCTEGKCETEAAAAVGPTYNGIFSLGQPTGSTQWNIMIVIIQLCILAVCCLSLGLSISFCFKNPNRLMGASGFHKAQSFGRDQ